jgi:hypothetical protein
MGNKGKYYEHAIVNCYRRRNFEEHTPDVVSATLMLIEVFPDEKIVHRDEIRLSGLGHEVKADMWIVLRSGQWIGISIKMAGPVRLSSAQGRGTADKWEAAATTLEGAQRSTLQKLNKIVRELPTNMIDSKNLQKAQLRNPKKLATAGNWNTWFANERPPIAQHINEQLEDTAIRGAIVEEMLTGRQHYAGTKGVADYILTPYYFKYIDDSYIQNTVEQVKIDVRGKSRGGITSACVHFDITIR